MLGQFMNGVMKWTTRSKITNMCLITLSLPLLELTSNMYFKILVCKMHADNQKDDNTRNGSRKFLTSSLTVHMKGLNISEVSKSYKPHNVSDNRYEATERN